MKFGLVVCSSTDNFGDDILSYASYRFLPKVDYIIDRENADTFIPDSKEAVAAIFNGWFLYNKFNWPPSEYIYPLFIGVHFTSNKRWGIENEYLDQLGKDYLRRYAPVGCRDRSTVAKMNQRNIEAYFSGCLTLTLQPFENIRKTKKIILVDLSEKLRDHIIQKMGPENIEIITHAVTIKEKEWLKRKENVENVLKKYQSADTVITTRLHCALPCLALGTKVLMVCKFDEDYNSRISSYKEYLNTCTENELLTEKINLLNIPENPADFKQMANTIKNICTDFINNSINKGILDLPDITFYSRYWSRKINWQRNLLKNGGRDEITELYTSKKWLEEQYDSLNTELENCKKTNAEQKKYIEELQTSKKWLEEQYDSLNTELENYKKTNADQKKYIEELQTAKKWLEKQYSSLNIELKNGKSWLEQHSEEQEKYIKSLLKNK